MPVWLAKILTSILDKLPPSDRCLFGFFLLLALLCWWLIGATNFGTRCLWLRTAGLLLSTTLFLVAVFFNHYILLNGGTAASKLFVWSGLTLLTTATALLYIAAATWEPLFSEKVTGILILQITGDTKQAMQSDLLGQLNSQLDSENTENHIEIHADHSAVDESNGLTSAHLEARVAGESANAKFVIWGRVTDGRRFYPRLTIVHPEYLGVASKDRTYDVQSIGEVQLPKDVLDAPFYLTNFANGLSAYYRGQNDDALRYFEAALDRKGALPSELGDIQFFAGLASLTLALGDIHHRDTSVKAVRLLELASQVYGTRQRIKWAIAQNNLAAAYSDLQSGKRAENLLNAISASQNALTVFTERNSPDAWARANTNLGSAYGDLHVGDRKDNLTRAIDAFDAALRVRRKTESPKKWSSLKNCLGLAYRQLGEVEPDTSARLITTAISLFHEALNVATEASDPFTFAEIQSNLGNAYGSLEPPQFDKARQCYTEALRIFRRADFPTRWALAQANLGKINLDEAIRGMDRHLLEKALNLFRGSLEVLNETDSPTFWATTNRNAGLTLLVLARMDKDDVECREAIAHLESTLRVTNKPSPSVESARIQDLLAHAYFQLESGDRVDNIKKARNLWEASEKVLTRDADPVEWAQIQLGLGKTFCNLMSNPVTDLAEAKQRFEAAQEVFAKRDLAGEYRETRRQLDRLNGVVIEVPENEINLPGASFYNLIFPPPAQPLPP